jgi:hypothetical protein
MGRFMRWFCRGEACPRPQKGGKHIGSPTLQTFWAIWYINTFPATSGRGQASPLQIESQTQKRKINMTKQIEITIGDRVELIDCEKMTTITIDGKTYARVVDNIFLDESGQTLKIDKINTSNLSFQTNSKNNSEGVFYGGLFGDLHWYKKGTLAYYSHIFLEDLSKLLVYSFMFTVVVIFFVILAIIVTSCFS